MKKAILIATGLCLLSVATVEAQQAVVTVPLVTTTTASSGTITTGDAFQSVLAASSSRRGCILQNTSSHTMYVFAGPNANATTGKSLQLAPGAIFYCPTYSGTVGGDNISVTTSTAGDTYVIWSE